MDCDRCGADAVLAAAYSGQHLCETHLRRSVEKRVRRRVRSDNLLPDDATPDDPETWVIGLSGGKDSVALATILHDTFAADPRVELVALSVHEGIEGYRDESLAASRELVADLGIRHEEVSYEEEYGVRMDQVVGEDPHDMAACAYCGVFRREALDRHAESLGADKLLTGHNLDDVAETALMNVLEGDVERMARQFDASLGPFPGSSADPVRDVDSAFVPRAKPLRDVPEKEVALYVRLRNLPAHMAECPHADESFRGEIRDLLLGLEETHPGTRHSIVAGYEELAGMAADSRRQPSATIGECERCGGRTSADVCRTCSLLEAF